MNKIRSLSGSTILLCHHLKTHCFKELDAFANNKEKTLSGSNFLYIGMCEKDMDSIYVQLLPAFIKINATHCNDCKLLT
jgi:hypothetical protein